MPAANEYVWKLVEDQLFRVERVLPVRSIIYLFYDIRL